MKPSWLRKALKLALVPGLILATFGGAQLVQGQTSSGLVLTGGDPEGRVLPYFLDNGTVRRLDRYRLDIPPQTLAVAELQLNFDERYDGRPNPDQVRLEVEGTPVELREVNWIEDVNSLEVVTAEPITAGQNMRLVLSQVRNPRQGGFYRIQSRLLGTEPNPIFRYVGLWVLTID